jgi:putative transposase
MTLDDRERPLRFLIHDHDAKFSGGFAHVFESDGMTVIRTPIQAPNANAHTERWVGPDRQLHRRDLLGGLIHQYEHAA